MNFASHAYQAYKNYMSFDNPDHTFLKSFTQAPPEHTDTLAEQSYTEIKPGVFAMSVSEFFARHADPATTFIQATKYYWKHRQIYAYADAFASRTLIVYVQPGTMLKEPLVLHTLFETSECDSYKIIIGARAQVTIIDTCVTSSQENSNYVRSISYHVGTHATLSVVHDLQPHQAHIAHAHLFVCDAYATVTVEAVLTAGQDTKIWFDILMQGSESHITVRGIGIATDNSQKLSVITEQQHEATHTTADLAIAACVLFDAYISYHGRIHIAQSAQNTESKQRNKILLCSDAARAVSVPSLEALAHQVHCVHATAVGMLDKDQLHYLQSRGLSYEHARTTLLQGFIQAAVSDESLVAHAIAYIKTDS